MIRQNSDGPDIMETKPPQPWRLSAWLSLALLSVGVLSAVAGPRLPPLTNIDGSPRLPGKFVWADLVTDDVRTAQKFYSQLFGWTFRDLGHYAIAANDERPLGGIFQRPKPANADARPRWFGYLSVANVAHAEQTVTKAGGKVLAAPQKMPDRGEQAVFADPEGAVFGVIRSSAGDPGDFMADPGDWIWIQLLSRDGGKAAEFYRAVGGYEVLENTNRNRSSDYVLASDGYARATVRTIVNETIKPNWLPFVRVKSVTESLVRTRQLGGEVLIAPKPEALRGKVAVIADPTGAAIGILEWHEDLLKEGN